MGDLADDVIEGRSCSICGTYFVEEHGYPVVCEDCWDDSTPKERKNLQKAIHPEI